MRSEIRSVGAWRGTGKGWSRIVGGAWVAFLAVSLLGSSGARRAEAQGSGGAQAGQNRAAPAGYGQVSPRSQGAAPYVTSAQGVASTASSRSPYGQLNYGRPFVSGDVGPSGDVEEAGFLDGDLHNGQWSGLIDRNFRIMRRTSPFPNQFAGGMFNRRPFFPPFGAAPFGFFSPTFGAFSYGGYAFDYGPSIYGGYVPSVYSLYGSWYPPYLPQDRVYIIEREVVPQPAPPAPQPRDQESKAAGDKPTSADDGEYYLSPRSGETLDDALAAIRQAWMNGDYGRLKSRLADKGRVRIFLKGKYKYAVDASDFSQMTQDAMKRIDTISFTLDRVKRLSDDRAFASGEHVYYDPDHVKHEVYVSYGLIKEDGRWRIVEAGSSTEPIASHGD